MLKWEHLLQRTYTPQQWYCSLQTPLKFSKCLLHWETVQKIYHNWCLTPTKLAHIYPTTSNLCWRNCGSPGTPLYIWWDCPVLTTLLSMLSKLLLSILSVPVPLTLQMVLLGLELEPWPKPSRIIISHALIATRLAIAKNWKSPLPPSSGEIITHF